MIPDLRLVVFDMDGTLIDSQDHILSGMEQAFRLEGLDPPDRQDILGIVGLSLVEAMAVLVPDLSAATHRRLADQYRESFKGLRARSGGEAAASLYPGALAALGRLHRRDDVLMGVATGKSRRGLDHTFRSHGIGSYFVTAQTADTHPSKPHPSMLEAAAQEAGIDRTRVVMIGDTDFDIAMGQAAGCATIAVSWGYHPLDRLERARPDRIIDSFCALDAVLEDIWKVRT